jgi:hypothetical protein
MLVESMSACMYKYYRQVSRLITELMCQSPDPPVCAAKSPPPFHHLTEPSLCRCHHMSVLVANGGIQPATNFFKSIHTYSLTNDCPDMRGTRDLLYPC